MFAWLASILGYIVVPFDVYYAYPGFQAILNEPKYATVAAFLFGLILLSIGTLLAALTQQLFNRKPESIRPTFKAVIPSRALLLFIVLALGLATVFAGATIRSIVPESQHISQRRVEIQLRIQQIQQFDVNESTTGVDLAQRQADLEYLAIEDKQLSDDAKILSMVLSPVLTADAILAFCFYLFALVSVFCSRILSTDPVFEYHIASLSRESAQRALLFYESKIEEGIGMADRIVTTLNGEIAELEADKLEEIDRSADEQAEEERIEVEAHEKQYYADLRYRCLRYAKYLSLLRRDKNIIRQWEEYFDRVSTKS